MTFLSASLNILGSKEGLIVKTSLLIYMLLACIWYFNTDAPWDDDCVTRYYNSLLVWENPKHFIALWNRPLFMILFAIPFQFGKQAILLMTVFVAAGTFFLYTGMKRKQESFAFMVIPFLLFQVFFFPISYSSLAEPLAAVLICLGYFFLSKRNFLAFAITGALLPLARLELAVILVCWGLVLLKEKQLRYVWIFAVPTVLWSLCGTIIDGDPLWLYEQTIGKETDSNRYGHTDFWHYFTRFIYVIGPAVFYFFFVGLFTDTLKRKLSVFVHLQFLVGFMVYVIFSWKLNLGQAAGFLRHLVVLSPLVAIIATRGFNNWIEALKPILDGKKQLKSAAPDPVDAKESELQRRLAKLEERAEKEGLKRREVRHLTYTIEKEIDREFGVSHFEIKEETKKDVDEKTSFVEIIVLSTIGIALIYFFSSVVLKNHHKLSEDPYYLNVMVMAGIFGLFLMVKLMIKNMKQGVVLFLAALVAIGTVGFTLATETPDLHNSPERVSMTRLAELVVLNDLGRHDIYVNHSWFFWSSGIDRDEAKFGAVRLDSLEVAKDSSIVIWENHYSTRLAGDVQMNHLLNDGSMVPLFSVRSTDNAFNGIVFQKWPHNSISARKKLYRDLHERMPDEPSVLVYLGNIISKEERNPQEAIKYYDDALRINKLHMEALHNKSLALMNSGNVDQSISLLEGIVGVFPGIASMHYLLGLANNKAKRYKEAIPAFSKAIELKKRYWEAHDNRGLAHFNLKNWTMAVQDYNQVVALQPGNKGQAFYNRGVTYSNLGQKDSGCSDLNQALNLGFKDAERAISQFCR